MSFGFIPQTQNIFKLPKLFKLFQENQAVGYCGIKMQIILKSATIILVLEVNQYSFFNILYLHKQN